MLLDEFCDYDHVLVSPTGGPFEGPTDEGLARIGRSRTVRYSVPSFLLVPELLQAGDLIALVPSQLVRSHDRRIKLFKPPVEVAPFDVIAVWHPRTDKDGAHLWLRTRLAKTARAPEQLPTLAMVHNRTSDPNLLDAFLRQLYRDRPAYPL